MKSDQTRQEKPEQEDLLSKILKYWAADKEQVSALQISKVEYDFDSGWPGTEVTPGDPPQAVVKYSVTRHVVNRIDAKDLGSFIAELARVYSRGPFC